MIWAETRIFGQRREALPPLARAVRALELRALADAVRAEAKAGAKPKSSPVSRETARVKSRTVASGAELKRDVAVALTQEGDEGAGGGEGDCQAQSAAGQGQQECFRQALADNSRAAGAESETGCGLVPAGGGAGKQEVGQVGTSDQQDQTDHGHEDLQGIPILAAQTRDTARGGDEWDGDVVDLLLASLGYGCAFIGANTGADLLIEPLLTLREGGAAGCCLGTEAAEKMQEVGPGLGKEGGMLENHGLHGDWYPQAGRFKFHLDAVELFRHDANDGEWRAIDGECFSQDGGISGK